MARTRLIAGMLVAAGSAIPSLAIAQNLVTNPSFENGGLRGWSHVGKVGANDSLPTHSGIQIADFFGASPSDSGTLSQTIATTSGQQYTFSFFYRSDGQTPNALTASFNGTQLFSTTNAISQSYIQESYNVIANSDSSTISFTGYNQPGDIGIDDVSFVRSGPNSPEPATWSLMILGFGIVGGTLRRQKRRVVSGTLIA